MLRVILEPRRDDVLDGRFPRARGVEQVHVALSLQVQPGAMTLIRRVIVRRQHKLLTTIVRVGFRERLGRDRRLQQQLLGQTARKRGAGRNL